MKNIRLESISKLNYINGLSCQVINSAMSGLKVTLDEVESDEAENCAETQFSFLSVSSYTFKTRLSTKVLTRSLKSLTPNYLYVKSGFCMKIIRGAL